jgi:transcriptional accessory protein Tex/SPT6
MFVSQMVHVIHAPGLLHINEIKKSEAFLQVHFFTFRQVHAHRPLALSQVGDTVRLLVQEVDIPRRRLSLALEQLDNSQAGTASATLSASAGQKRMVEPLGVADSSSCSSKRLKQ